MRQRTVYDFSEWLRAAERYVAEVAPKVRRAVLSTRPGESGSWLVAFEPQRAGGAAAAGELAQLLDVRAAGLVSRYLGDVLRFASVDYDHIDGRVMFAISWDGGAAAALRASGARAEAQTAPRARRIELKVPPARRAYARRKGARYDERERGWYTTSWNSRLAALGDFMCPGDRRRFLGAASQEHAYEGAA